MKTFTAVLIAATATLATAQMPTMNGDNTFTCAIANGVYCAGDSLSNNIIIRCNGTVGQAGNCNDNLAGEPPVGISFSPCYSPALGQSACSKNGIVYGGSGNLNGTFPVPGTSSTASSSASATSTASSNSTISASTTTASSNSTTSASTTTGPVTTSKPISNSTVPATTVSKSATATPVGPTGSVTTVTKATTPATGSASASATSTFVPASAGAMIVPGMSAGIIALIAAWFL